MDLTSSNLQATNEKFNKVLSNLESTKADALANLETAASTATSAISSQLANVVGAQTKAHLKFIVEKDGSVSNVDLVRGVIVSDPSVAQFECTRDCLLVCIRVRCESA